VNNVISFLQVGAVNKGRKTAKTSIMGSGRGMNVPPGRDSAVISFYLTSRGFHARFFSLNCTKSSLGRFQE
jgi:hypothetical protein